MLLSEASHQYRNDVIIFGNQSKKTEENHLVTMNNLIAYQGDIDIRNLTFDRVRDWKLDLDKGRSAETVRNYIIKLRVVLAYLQKRGIACLDPDSIPVPKRKDKVPQFLHKDQIAYIIDQTGSIRARAIVSLLYASGIRSSELCSLNKEDIHDDSFTVVGKGGKARLCFIDDRANLYLKMYLSTRDDHNPALFVASTKRRITNSNVQEIFRNLQKKTGIPIHAHTLRHSFATNLLKNNANMRYVQVLLGHSSLETTQMYTHVVDEDLRKIYSDTHTI